MMTSPKAKTYTLGARRRLRTAAEYVGIVLALVCFHRPAAAATADSTISTAGQDTTGVVAPWDSAAVVTALGKAERAPLFVGSDLDTVSQKDYLSRHSFSLDHFMEFEPGFVLNRSGPIGKGVNLSRFGFGRGRGTVYLGGVPINNPQNDVAPMVHFPTSGIGSLVMGDDFAGTTLAADGLEGQVRIIEISPPVIRPNTFVEVSKGKNDLRQRRVRFSSAKSSFGIDLGYDELLNNGYSFDARQLSSTQFTRGQDYGKSRSRHHSMNLRGELPGDEHYLVSFRKFTSTSDGDLTSPLVEQRLSGHLASVTATLNGLKMTFFDRGYSSTHPDSHAVNQTTAGYVDWRPVASPRGQIELGGGFEDIVGTMEVAGSNAQPRIRKSTARIAATSELWHGTVGRFQISGVDYHGNTTGWGGSLGISSRFGRHAAALDLRRGYRMPNLGELFLPAHPAGSGGATTVSGNRYLKSEYAWETGGRFTMRFGSVTNEVRWTAIQVENPILFASDEAGGRGDWLIASNGGRERLAIVEDRIKVETEYKGLEFTFAGSAWRAGGDREAYFVSVPRNNVLVSARVGANLFEATSALYFGVEYAYRSSRRKLEGGRLPSYNVFNFKLDGRLLDANMYLVLLNAFNETYQTADGYLMTPRTFVYGLAWTLFE